MHDQSAPFELIPGPAVVIVGREFIVPPLSLKRFKRAIELLPALEAGDAGVFDAVAELAHLAISRNYPDLTRDALEEMLDAQSVPRVLAAVLEASGLNAAGSLGATPAAAAAVTLVEAQHVVE